MELKFYKYHGTGNDFIIINNLDGKYSLLEQEIKLLCDRHFGIGADGFMEVLSSNKYDFAMKYYNADGKEGTMCGNGGRCIVMHAYKQGIIKQKTTFEAIDGEHRATVENNAVILKMNDVFTYEKRDNSLIVDTGSPHLVKFVKNLKEYPVEKEGARIRYSSEFPNGINVNFVEMVDNKLMMRTYERGVEAETLSCGTGTVAVSIASFLFLEVKSPVTIHAPGGVLEVSFNYTNKGFTDIFLKGPAQFVFEGKIKL